MGPDPCPLCLSLIFGVGKWQRISSLLKLVKGDDVTVPGNDDDDEALFLCSDCDNLIDSASSISNSISQLQLKLKTEIEHIRTIIFTSQPNFGKSESDLSEKIVKMRESILISSGAEDNNLSEEGVIKTEVDDMDTVDERRCHGNFSKLRKCFQECSGQQDKAVEIKAEVEDEQNFNLSFMLEPEANDEMEVEDSGLKTENSDEEPTSESEWILPDLEPKRRRIDNDSSCSSTLNTEVEVADDSQEKMSKVAKINGSTRSKAYAPGAKNLGVKIRWKKNSKVLDKEIKVLKKKRKTGAEFKIYLCPLCNKEFERTLELVIHLLKKHETEDKPFPCTKCDKKYTQKINLQRHLELHAFDKEKPLICEWCETRFEDKATLELHISSTHVKAYNCAFCSKRFTSHRNLKSHVRFLHNEAGGLQFSCDEPGCGASFKYKGTLQSHQIKMHKKDPVTCEACGKQFVSVKVLRRHTKSAHEGIKSFKCEICSTSFAAKNSLQAHVALVHSTERPFVCSFCGKGFKLKHALKAHEQSVHSKDYVRNLKYICGQCPKKFEHKHILEGHVRQVHTGERPFLCHVPDCGLAYAQRTILTDHLRKVHGLMGKSSDRGPRSKRDV